MCLEKWDLLRPPGLPVSDFLKLFNAAGPWISTLANIQSLKHNTEVPPLSIYFEKTPQMVDWQLLDIVIIALHLFETRWCRE